MIRWVFLLRRRPGMSTEDFRDYYERHHARLGEKHVPQAARYVRRFLDPPPLSTAPVDDADDVITELWFLAREDLDAAVEHLSSPAVQAEIVADELRLFDRSRTRSYLVVEHDSPVQRASLAP
ncbi:EthD domain-containing protein [Nocardioides sp. IC4_145]|uniref:EthD domain-containing protein n=1 Tax=Nocardioides sp. IC4_145 TaxID=2714037 RepID=UPI001408EDEF|nr:EthD domain-containing protein [Nocardioides sp. IC4_145]NHC21889.1 EthD domain-containing protein [Nocardioides sp. IC4_145]